MQNSFRVPKTIPLFPSSVKLWCLETKGIQHSLATTACNSRLFNHVHECTTMPNAIASLGEPRADRPPASREMLLQARHLPADLHYFAETQLGYHASPTQDRDRLVTYSHDQSQPSHDGDLVHNKLKIWSAFNPNEVTTLDLTQSFP